MNVSIYSLCNFYLISVTKLPINKCLHYNISVACFGATDKVLQISSRIELAYLHYSNGNLHKRIKVSRKIFMENEFQ